MKQSSNVFIFLLLIEHTHEMVVHVSVHERRAKKKKKKKKKKAWKKGKPFSYYHQEESKVLQYFSNMRQNSAAQDVFLSRSWRCWKTLDYEMQGSPDTLQVLLARFASLD